MRGLDRAESNVMDDVVAVEIQLVDGGVRYVITWGRIQGAVDPAPLEGVVLEHSRQLDLGGTVERARVCHSLREAADSRFAPYFYECLLDFARLSIPSAPTTNNGVPSEQPRWLPAGRSPTAASRADGDERPCPHRNSTAEGPTELPDLGDRPSGGLPGDLNGRCGRSPGRPTRLGRVWRFWPYRRRSA